MKRTFGKRLRDAYWWAWLHFPHNREAEIEALAERGKQVQRVCTVYPHPVSHSAMDRALTRLGLAPEPIYARLARGESIPELDALTAKMEWPDGEGDTTYVQ